ncbi:MAG: nucleotidyltransferase domain-containing protein [Thermodesulfobacteriota bacterium]|nr:nucleotidyltransferase domain-containing protein [Thermodesulfobacteriota bacterium]
MKKQMVRPNYSMNKKEKNAFGLTDRDIKTLQDIFKKYPDVKNVFIFGSRAKGTYKQGSDIDLAIMNEGVKDTVIGKMKSDFEDSSLPYTVDLVNYHTIKHPELKNHVDRIGVPFYEKMADKDKTI